MLALMTSCAVPAVSFAQGTQESPDEQQAESQAKNTTGEIIVTANRRSESIQKVGASVMAFNGEQLENLKIQSAGDLAGLTPNVDFKKQWGSKGNASLFYNPGYRASRLQ